MAKKEIASCKYCNYCKNRGAANRTGNNLGREPRKTYYCENPLTYELPAGSFGNRAHRFIGYGTSDWGSPLNMKTSPKWCPLR